jgi:hypothetical protein
VCMCVCVCVCVCMCVCMFVRVPLYSHATEAYRHAAEVRGVAGNIVRTRDK